MKHLFWIIWSIELGVMLWWLWTELKLTYISVNPMVFAGFGWLAAALFLKTALQMDKPALVMVGIPAIPLGIMAIFLIVIFLVSIFGGPIRWN